MRYEGRRYGFRPFGSKKEQKITGKIGDPENHPQSSRRSRMRTTPRRPSSPTSVDSNYFQHTTHHLNTLPPLSRSFEDKHRFEGNPSWAQSVKSNSWPPPSLKRQQRFFKTRDDYDNGSIRQMWQTRFALQAQPPQTEQEKWGIGQVIALTPQPPLKQRPHTAHQEVAQLGKKTVTESTMRGGTNQPEIFVSLRSSSERDTSRQNPPQVNKCTWSAVRIGSMQ